MRKFAKDTRRRKSQKDRNREIKSVIVKYIYLGKDSYLRHRLAKSVIKDIHWLSVEMFVCFLN